MAEENLTPDTPAADTGTGSSRDDVVRAFEQVEARDANRDAPPEKPAAPPAAAGGAPAGLLPAGDRARGPDGRFVEKPAPEAPAPGAQKAQDKPAAPGATGGDKQALQPAQRAPEQPGKAPEHPATPPTRAPAAWKPVAREHWGKLPPEVQAEVIRRESEVSRAMQESARARDTLQHVQRVIGPYAANIAAGGGDALQAIDGFFRADNTLRHGSQGDKAALVANIIKNYGVDLNTLDAVLAGQPAPNDPMDAMRREMRQQLQPVMGFMERMNGNRERALSSARASAGSEVEAFGQDAAHEFFEDVRGDMADIIDLAAARHQPITLQEAYDRAILLNKQVREIVARREETERASAAAQAAQRARRTAASLSSSGAPAGSPGPAADDRRAVIEAAWDAASSG